MLWAYQTQAAVLIYVTILGIARNLLAFFAGKHVIRGKQGFMVTTSLRVIQFPKTARCENTKGLPLALLCDNSEGDIPAPEIPLGTG